MQINRNRQKALFTALSLSVAGMANAEIIAIKGGDVRTTSDVANGTVLKTYPVMLPTAPLPQRRGYEVTSPFALWDAGRGIYQSALPGIGFSVCQREGENCLIAGGNRMVPGPDYKLRIYKTGELKGGDYSPGTLLRLSDSQNDRQINLTHLVVHNLSCTVTKKRVTVTFPATTLSYRKEKLAQAAFTLPVNCHNPEDYRNVMVSFTYGGKQYDDTTLQTNLAGLGIRLYDAAGNAVRIRQPAPVPSQSMQFVANLVRLPGQKIEAGEINVSATATITLR